MPHFTAIDAFESNNQVHIGWRTENQNTLTGFDIQKSKNRISFITLNNIQASNGVNSYQWTDANPGVGDNYYRIGSIATDGSISYSNIIKVTGVVEKTGFNIYPNPATANNFNLQMANQKAGTYEINLVNSYGQIIMTKIRQDYGGTSVEKLQTQQNIPPGVYHVEIKHGGNIVKVINVVL